MFKHETASWCRFREACSYNLCQFRHKQGENIESEQFNCKKCEHVFENNDDMIIHKDEDNFERTALNEHDSYAGQSEELFPCDSCDKIYDEIDDLIEHYGETAHNI